jgi:hypothetical protein
VLLQTRNAAAGVDFCGMNSGSEGVGPTNERFTPDNHQMSSGERWNLARTKDSADRG